MSKEKRQRLKEYQKKLLRDKIKLFKRKSCWVLFEKQSYKRKINRAL